MTQAEENRFWSKVDRTGGAEKCWPWLSGKTGNGYGQFYSGYKTYYAHRFAHEAVNGAIPSGLFVLHACDNPPCCNPAHLSTGTHRENMRQKVMRRRHNAARGEANGRSKLRPVDVACIRAMVATSRFSNRAIGRLFGISNRHVSALANGECWREQ